MLSDRLTGLYLTISHAVQMKKPVTFQLLPVLHASKRAVTTTEELNNVHFLWLFGDEVSCFLTIACHVLTIKSLLVAFSCLVLQLLFWTRSM